MYVVSSPVRFVFFLLEILCFVHHGTRLGCFRRVPWVYPTNGGEEPSSSLKMTHALVPRVTPLEGVLEPRLVYVASSLFLFYIVTRVFVSYGPL